jgi:hypothetical protein
VLFRVQLKIESKLSAYFCEMSNFDTIYPRLKIVPEFTVKELENAIKWMIKKSSLDQLRLSNNILKIVIGDS